LLCRGDAGRTLQKLNGLQHQGQTPAKGESMQTKRFFNLMTGLVVICGLLAVGVIGGTEAEAKVTITVQMFSGPEYDAMEPTAVYWNENYAEKTGIKVKAIALSRVG
jgi:hypothetical protein